MDLETRVTNLENLVLSFIQNQNRVDEYKGYDIDGCRQTENLQATDISNNSNNISDNSSGIYDLADVVSEDSESIYDLADIVSELDERVSALEDK